MNICKQSCGLKEELLERINSFEKSAKNDRHEQNNKVHKLFSDIDKNMDEHKEEIINLKNDSQSMQKDIKKGFERMEKLFEDLSEKYVLKTDFISVRDKTALHNKIFVAIGLLVLGAIGTAFFKLIIIS